jgi:two-component system C4-dicarboxylate transport sensor histidine kinase DctB
MSDGTIPSLAAAHLRLGRAAVGIYVAASALALGLLVAFLFTELSHEEDELRKQVVLEADDRAHALLGHLDLLTRELQRLGLRSEVDLLDQNLEPERSLLELSHGSSTFFNLGVAIVSLDGKVAWAEPKRFLPVGRSFVGERWYGELESARTLRVTAVNPERPEDAALFVISPVVRNHRYQGALLGGIDLATSGLTIANRSIAGARTILAERGKVVFPARPPSFAESPEWEQLLSHERASFLASTEVDGHPSVVGGSPVGDSELTLAMLIDEDTLYGEARARLRSRLLIGLVLAAAPLVALIALLRHSLRSFRLGEEQAMREERLHRVGEAANLIAHEVKNSLNGIRMAAELACAGTPLDGRSARALTELRGEIERLTNFTGELMAFSKGIKPRPVRLELNDFAATVCELFEAQALEAGVELKLKRAASSIWVSADPQLLRIAVSNLLVNALEALATRSEGTPPSQVELAVEAAGDSALLRVSDNGDGVAPSVRARLFEPFQSGKASGVGIGLALGRRIALAHGGDLALQAAAVGASFGLTLPRETT